MSTFKTPGGSPASLKISPIAHAVRGANSGPFNIAVLPAAQRSQLSSLFFEACQAFFICQIKLFF